jgi:NAD(P)-dependent dehydrogenase (short-subunit alcohol dehydrogenase family)
MQYVSRVLSLSLDEIRAQFETNLFGAIRIMQAVLPTMRTQMKGKIINITSIGGRIAFPLNSSYHATKFALEGISESLQYEIEQFGIRIILIEPGVIKSNFYNNIKTARNAQRPDSPYARMMRSSSSAFEPLLQNGSPPQEVADTILKAATSDNPEFRYVIGNDAILKVNAKRNMSDMEFKKLIEKQYLDK